MKSFLLILISTCITLTSGQVLSSNADCYIQSLIQTGTIPTYQSSSTNMISCTSQSSGYLCAAMSLKKSANCELNLTLTDGTGTIIDCTIDSCKLKGTSASDYTVTKNPTSGDKNAQYYCQGNQNTTPATCSYFTIVKTDD